MKIKEYEGVYLEVEGVSLSFCLLGDGRCLSVYLEGAGVSLSFFPARIIEIWRPRLKAWLNSSLVWNSDTNGNQDKTAMGVKIESPIMYSYALPNSLIESQNPSPLSTPRSACPIFKKH